MPFYIARRLVWTAIVVAVVMLLTFVVFYKLPAGDPAVLVAGAAVLWLVSGVAIGVVSAVKRRSLLDRFAMGFALFGISTPVFWLGLMALFIFWRQLHLTGGTRYVPLTDSVSGVFSHMILPWCVLAP